jgi:hypothetical protein
MMVVRWLPLRSLAGTAPDVCPTDVVSGGFVLDREPAAAVGVELFVLDDMEVHRAPTVSRVK